MGIRARAAVRSFEVSLQLFIFFMLLQPLRCLFLLFHLQLNLVLPSRAARCPGVTISGGNDWGSASPCQPSEGVGCLCDEDFEVCKIVVSELGDWSRDFERGGRGRDLERGGRDLERGSIRDLERE